MSAPKYPNVSAQLSGRDGSAFSIISSVSAALKNAGVDRSDIEAFKKEAMSGDYDNVIVTAHAWVDVH